jgi:hypothetical protein
MNPQLTNALVQTRHQELRRTAESARLVRGITHRRHPLTALLRYVPAPRLSLRRLTPAGIAPDALNHL